jgi:hypothetical protein
MIDLSFECIPSVVAHGIINGFTHMALSTGSPYVSGRFALTECLPYPYVLQLLPIPHHRKETHAERAHGAQWFYMSAAIVSPLPGESFTARRCIQHRNIQSRMLQYKAQRVCLADTRCLLRTTMIIMTVTVEAPVVPWLASWINASRCGVPCAQRQNLTICSELGCQYSAMAYGPCSTARRQRVS